MDENNKCYWKKGWNFASTMIMILFQRTERKLISPTKNILKMKLSYQLFHNEKVEIVYYAISKLSDPCLSSAMNTA